MKKWLIGCGIVVLLCVIVCIGGVAYVGVKMGNWVKEWEAIGQEFQTLNEEYPFTAPEQFDLTTGRMVTFFEVRGDLADKLYNNEVIKELTATADTNQQPDIGLSGMMGLVFSFSQEVTRDFQDQLRQNEMSPAEYFYYAEAMYITIAEGEEAGDPEMTELYNALQGDLQGVNKELQKSNNAQYQVNFDTMMRDYLQWEAEVTEEDIQVVKDHMDQIKEYPIVSFMEFLFLAQPEAQKWQVEPEPVPVGESNQLEPATAP